MNTLPPDVADAFLAAAATTLQELANVEVFPERGVGQPASPPNGPVVVAKIQLLREPPGSMSLVLDNHTAANVASRYLPPGTALSPAIIDDVAGEFANVIAGQAKTMLKGSRYHFNLSTPTVFRAASLLEVHPDRTGITRLCNEIGLLALLVDLTGGELCHHGR